MSGNYSFNTGRVWVDHSDGRHILTLRTAAAGALQAWIPIWISLVGAASWILIKRLWYHQRFRRDRGKIQQSLFERQEQVLLRNSAGDLGTFWDAFSLWRTWRKSRHCTFRHVAPIMIGGILFWACWQVAGIVSFYIWQSRVPDVGLIHSPNCGYLVLNSSGDTLPFRSIGLSQTILAETWVSQCYTNSSQQSGACNLYPQQALGFKKITGVACPFASPSICISTNSTPHQMDTGPINSHSDLGINAPPNERITYRKNTTCSPVHGSPFAQVVNSNETDEADLWPADTVLQRYFFGPVNGSNETWTFEYNTWAPLDGIGYQITSLTHTPGPVVEGLNAEGWAPNATFFNRTDADLSLFILTANHVLYNFSSYDPMYLATESYTQQLGSGTYTYWVPTYFVNVLSCIDQHQICDPTRNQSIGCTAPMAWLQLAEAIFEMGLNDAQVAAAERIVANLVMTNTANSVNGRNAAALLASQTVSELLQTKALPVDQWRLEVENWFAVSLAKLQRAVIDYAGGPSDRSLTGYAKFPSDPQLARMCYSQLVKLSSSEYVNFNFDAIIGVFASGLFLVLVCFWFEDIFAFILKRRDSTGQLDWTFDGPYQLQRLAYAGRGVEGWVDEEEETPITSDPLPILTQSAAPQAPQTQSQTVHAASANINAQSGINNMSTGSAHPQTHPTNLPNVHPTSPQPSLPPTTSSALPPPSNNIAATTNAQGTNNSATGANTGSSPTTNALQYGSVPSGNTSQGVTSRNSTNNTSNTTTRTTT